MTTDRLSAPLPFCLAAALLLAAAGPAWAAGGGPCADCFAVLKGDGTLDRGNLVLQTQHPGTGRYTISFNGSVLACAFSAVLANGGKFTAPTGSITAGFGPQFYMVNVATFDVRGRPADRPFDLVVTC